MSSRFCILAVDVEPGTNAVKKKKKSAKAKQPGVEEKAKSNNDQQEKNKTIKLNNNKKKKSEQEERQLKAMAFGMGSSKVKKKVVKEPVPKKIGKGDTNKKEGNKVNGEAGVDEDWQRRDEEYVRDENERCLREAMILSKLDYEEKSKKEEEEEVTGAKVKKKKDKPVTMSLEQFNSMRIDKLPKKGEADGQDHPRPKNGKKFFEDIDETARKTAARESKKEQYKASAGQFNQAMLISEYESQIEKRDFEIQALRLEVESLKNDLQLVKSRNKKLCEVICAAEMKSKAELVVELDKMTKIREELTQEVGSLSGQLEQERSRVNMLSGDAKKQGRKKQ